jgi:hypothetical protein
MQVWGFDVSERAVTWAREQTRGKADSSLQFHLGDVSDMLRDLPATAVRAFVVMREVIEHLPEEEIDRVLGLLRTQLPGTDLVISVPSTNSPTDAKHFRPYTPDSLVQTLRRNGYDCGQVIGYGFRPKYTFKLLKTLKGHLNRSRLFWWILNPAWRRVRPAWEITLAVRAWPDSP